MGKNEDLRSPLAAKREVLLPVRPDATSHPTPLTGRPVSVGPTLVKQRTYEQLDGAEGRQVFFRPQRYQRSDLGQVRAKLRLTLPSGEPRECEFVDVSQNGVAFEWPRDLPVQPGAIVPLLTVTFDEHEAYRGEARVGSVRETQGKIVVGVSFVDSLMNVDDVLQLRDVKAYRGESQGLGLLNLPWRLPGHERFKALVGELRLFLEDAAQKLAELESRLPWNVVHGDQSSPARDELVRLVQAEFVSEFVRLSEEIDLALRAATASPSKNSRGRCCTNTSSKLRAGCARCASRSAIPATSR